MKTYRKGLISNRHGTILIYTKAAPSPPPFECSLDCRRARCVSIVVGVVINPIHWVHLFAFICGSFKIKAACVRPHDPILSQVRIRAGKIITTPTSSLIREHFKGQVQDARQLNNRPIAYDHANNFRQDLQDGQDLNVGLCHPVNPVHPVHYVCVPC